MVEIQILQFLGMFQSVDVLFLQCKHWTQPEFYFANFSYKQWLLIQLVVIHQVDFPSFFDLYDGAWYFAAELTKKVMISYSYRNLSEFLPSACGLLQLISPLWPGFY